MLEGRDRIELGDRYRGCLIGIAVGDAFGQPLEFLPIRSVINRAKRQNTQHPWEQILADFQEKIQTEYGGLVAEMLDNPFGNWQKGEYTDDTSQTLALVDSLNYHGYNLEQMVRHLLIWHNNEHAKGMGKTTRDSLKLHLAGHSIEEVAARMLTSSTIPSNGSLMRTAPIGLYFREQSYLIDQAAKEVSMLTHAHPDAILACQIASNAIARLSSGATKEELKKFIFLVYPEAEEKFVEAKANRERYPGGAFVTLDIALESFFTSDSFEQSIIKAANLGGDTDTQASVTGAFAGAYWGLKSIPKEWRSLLSPLNAEQIEEKAHLLGLFSMGVSRNELIGIYHKHKMLLPEDWLGHGIIH